MSPTIRAMHQTEVIIVPSCRVMYITVPYLKITHTEVRS